MSTHVGSQRRPSLNDGDTLGQSRLLTLFLQQKSVRWQRVRAVTHPPQPQRTPEASRWERHVQHSQHSLGDWGSTAPALARRGEPHVKQRGSTSPNTRPASSQVPRGTLVAPHPRQVGRGRRPTRSQPGPTAVATTGSCVALQ